MSQEVGFLAAMGFSVQMKDGSGNSGQVHSIAGEGVRDGGGQLPHLAQIQRSFGQHDITGVRAHTDSRGNAAAKAMGAEAYATDNHIAFASSSPSLQVDRVGSGQ
ncbi:MAG: DUF4157 domain-containing protein [Proteobacteria bacterium]|nr:DUF4157 domain-containing protein [Pseudomonadota bacterium]